MRKAREERERIANQFKRGEPKIDKKYQHSNKNKRALGKNSSSNQLSSYTELENASKTRGGIE